MCDDYLDVMAAYMRKHALNVPDRQLACAHIGSDEGRRYLSGLAAAANYAFANRQLLAHQVRETVQRVLRLGPRDAGIRTVYDVGHNNAKFESHEVDGRRRDVLVHRKGATRAFPPGHPELPAAYRDVRPAGVHPRRHGEGLLRPRRRARGDAPVVRVHMPRGGPQDEPHVGQAERPGEVRVRGDGAAGVLVACTSRKTLAEEIPEAYKEVGTVVDVVDRAGIARKVARLRPLAVVKG